MVFHNGIQISHPDFKEPIERDWFDLAKWVSASCFGDHPFRESEAEYELRHASQKTCVRHLFSEGTSAHSLSVRVFGLLDRFFDFDWWSPIQLVGVYLYGILFSLLPSGLILWIGQRKLKNFNGFKRRLIWILTPLVMGVGLILLSFTLRGILGEGGSPWVFRLYLPSLIGIPALFSALAFVPIWLIGEKRLDPESTTLSMRQLAVLYFFAPLIIQVIGVAVAGLRDRSATKKKTPTKRENDQTSGVSLGQSTSMKSGDGKFGGGGASSSF